MSNYVTVDGVMVSKDKLVAKGWSPPKHYVGEVLATDGYDARLTVRCLDANGEVNGVNYQFQSDEGTWFTVGWDRPGDAAKSKGNTHFIECMQDVIRGFKGVD